MDVTFTIHAQWRLTKRKILREEVIDAVKYPDIILKKYGKYYYQKQLNRGVIEIVCEKTGYVHSSFVHFPRYEKSNWKLFLTRLTR